MSKTGKTIAAILVIIIIGAIWWIIAKPSSPASGNAGESAAPFMVETGAPAGASPVTASSVTASSSVDTDLNSIDTEMNGLNQDDANVDTSVSPPSNQ